MSRAVWGVVSFSFFFFFSFSRFFILFFLLTLLSFYSAFLNREGRGGCYHGGEEGGDGKLAVLLTVKQAPRGLSTRRDSLRGTLRGIDWSSAFEFPR